MPNSPSDLPPKRFRDEDTSDIESRSSTPVSQVDPTTAKWYHREGSSSWYALTSIRSWTSRRSGPLDPERTARRRVLFRRLLIVCVVLTCFGVAAAITYISFVAALVHRLNPPRVSSGLQHIVDEWKEPTSSGAYTFEWREDFSRDIVPKNCHSHNDYWRRVPTYEALAAGCISIEADIWQDYSELLVSHSWRATNKERTLRSLYLDPLTNIFTNRNVSKASTEDKEVGVFDADPNVSVILLIDIKNEGHSVWPILLSQLQPLHDKGWLTYFDGTKLVKGPLTVVGTGNTPFELVQANNTNRFVFYDAPLDDISNDKYTTENSYYASIAINKAIGRIWFNTLTSSQVDTLKRQIKAAANKNLVSRYWDTPSWPISLRDKVWFTLTDNDVGMLNVDDLISATRWNWNWCKIAGLTLCGNS
ncbi:hypothetical protein BCR34DRAFT_479650 [Clohesyomyces aquaticus]|uniref:Altered inheritance of mitochondria protein 6 n=1 Tax=Clohesyomyces aquaticus TaxID=1231657 RepID=A0A1Y1ZW53_9PLEO|nr:hypothetical protein BCR34DRAFT_479650 [Clohesyomyces aquaticus]